jgi:hypothetical protein
MKLAIAALVAGSAAAFAPSAQKASSTSLKMGYESELGVQPPLGFFVSVCCSFAEKKNNDRATSE